MTSKKKHTALDWFIMYLPIVMIAGIATYYIITDGL